MIPKSPEAVFAWFEAQAGLGEYPAHSNSNWITKACNFDRQFWCSMCASAALIAGGFNDLNQVLDFGHAPNAPTWGHAPLPALAGLGMRTDYRWGNAWTWTWRDAAIPAGRWISDPGAIKPGDVICVNHNGRDKARNDKSHTCVALNRVAGGWNTWNGNISDLVKQVEWKDGVIEGAARPAYVTQPTQEDDDQMFSPEAQRFIQDTVINGVAIIDHNADQRRDHIIRVIKGEPAVAKLAALDAGAPLTEGLREMAAAVAQRVGELKVAAGLGGTTPDAPGEVAPPAEPAGETPPPPPPTGTADPVVIT